MNRAQVGAAFAALLLVLIALAGAVYWKARQGPSDKKGEDFAKVHAYGHAYSDVGHADAHFVGLVRMRVPVRVRVRMRMRLMRLRMRMRMRLMRMRTKRDVGRSGCVLFALLIPSIAPFRLLQ